MGPASARAALEAVAKKFIMDDARAHDAAGHANLAQSGLSTRIGTLPQVSDSPAACASASRSSRIIAKPWPLAVEPSVPISFSPAITGKPSAGREFIIGDPHDCGCARSSDARRGRRLPVRHSTLTEINAGELVHVGLVRERVAIDEIHAAARHAERDAVRLVSLCVGERGAEIGGRLRRQMRRQHHPQAELGQPRIGIAKPVVGIPLAVPTPPSRRPAPPKGLSAITLARSL